MLKISAISFIILILVDQHYGFQSGAPEDVCLDMTPKHYNAKPQLPPAPYKITIDKFSIPEDGTIGVSIGGSEVFRGFLLQARDSQQKIVGKFESHSSAKLLNCLSGTNNAITHRNATDKFSIVLKWKPAGFKGSANFVATVLKSAPIFWTQLKSPQFEVV
uniref:Reelin domain-containing protein n=1 Tax=Maconellicoccus hirsutus TaxID=177089 RepID=A2I454_MACHI|nr:hypothetical protein [Maconellicoccus hirsutus]